MDKRKGFYLIAFIALILNIGVELTSLWQPLDEALEASLFAIILVMVLLLYSGEGQPAKA